MERAPPPPVEVCSVSNDVEPEEEEEVEVEEVVCEGVIYLRSSKGIMYDTETSEEIGRWNYERNTIEVE
jgi:hypothetical protein